MRFQVSPEDEDLLQKRWHPMGKRGLPGRSFRRPKGFPGARNGCLYLHRVILERILGRPLRAGEQTDHVNGDPFDNRRCNLRPATQQQNSRNMRHHGKKCQYKGVALQTNCKTYMARILLPGRPVYLGSYPTQAEAALAYDEAARRYFGAFARVNFPKSGEVFA